MATPDGPPPGRFRVEQRDGRLVVIDSVTGATPPTAAQRQAGWANGDDATPIVQRPVDATLAARDDTPVAAATSSAAAKAAWAAKPAVKFTTRRWFDARGPRAIALSTAGKRRIQRVFTLAVAATWIAILTAMAFDVVFVLLIATYLFVHLFKRQIADWGAAIIDWAAAA